MTLLRQFLSASSYAYSPTSIYVYKNIYFFKLCNLKFKSDSIIIFYYLLLRIGEPIQLANNLTWVSQVFNCQLKPA